MVYSSSTSDILSYCLSTSTLNSCDSAAAPPFGANQGFGISAGKPSGFSQVGCFSLASPFLSLSSFKKNRNGTMTHI